MIICLKEEKHNKRYKKWITEKQRELEKAREMDTEELDKLYEEYYKNNDGIY